MGLCPSVSGVPALDFCTIPSSPVGFRTSQTQPEPKRVVAAVENFALNSSKLPKYFSISFKALPVG